MDQSKNGWKVVTLILMFLLIGFASRNSFAQTNPAEDLFKSKCAMCHGPDGAAKTPMGSALKIRDLKSEEVQKQSDADLTQVVAKGKNKMPAFDGKLKKEQIDQLVAFIRQLAKK